LNERIKEIYEKYLTIIISEIEEKLKTLNNKETNTSSNQKP
jgi:hypothetical protein